MAVIVRWVEAFNRRDLEDLAALSDPDCELRPYLASMIEDTVYRGHDGLAAYFRDAGADGAKLRREFGVLFRSGDRVRCGAVQERVQPESREDGCVRLQFPFQAVEESEPALDHREAVGVRERHVHGAEAAHRAARDG